MLPHYVEAYDRLCRYAAKHSRVLGRPLGSGHEGTVYATTLKTAVKAHRFRPPYTRERDVYLRLYENQVTDVNGFTIPELLNYDDELMIIEMRIAVPPFILDFAAAYLDQRPDFDEEVIDEWEKEKIEEFGDRWPEVDQAIARLRRWKIYLSDIHRRNIKFPGES